MKIAAITSFKTLKAQQRPNNINYKPQASGFDSVSFSGKLKQSEPIFTNTDITTLDKNEGFKANEDEYSLFSEKNSIETVAKKFDAGIYAYKNIVQNNRDAKIGTNREDYSLFAFGDIYTNAKEYKGGVFTQENIIQDNRRAVVGHENMNEESLVSDCGSVSTNAKYINGNIHAERNVYILGNVDVKGTVNAVSGTIYLVGNEAKSRSDYYIFTGSLVERISMEEYENEHLPDLLADFNS